MNNATSKSQRAQRAGTPGTPSPERDIIHSLRQPHPGEDGYLYPGQLKKASK